MVVGYLGDAPGGELEVIRLAISRDNVCLALLELRDERLVLRQDLEDTLCSRQRDRERLSVSLPGAVPIVLPV